MSETRQFVFVYGTLKKGYGANYKLEKDDFVGEFISESRFRIFGSGFPMAILSTDGHPVRGEVYNIRPSTLVTLDAYEGYPHFYNRSQLIFKSVHDESRLAAWMYHITDYEDTSFHHPLVPSEDGTLTWTK